ncbi:hypothetical protein [Streptomyces sp. NPDC059881]|uniref:hypothetical protein n=1 Tax=Streptomyces sp. NPDC059881 TaxID=3346986 RepID=UPI003656AE14
MEFRVKAVVRGTMCVAVLVAVLTGCGSSASEGKPDSSGDRTANTENDKASPSPTTEWSPALTVGQPAAGLFEPHNAPGGKFQVTLDKIVKGTQEQMEDGHFDEGEFAGGTPYFVYVTYALKGGQTDVGNPDLNAAAVVLDENGEEAAKRPVSHAGYVEGGCPVAPVWMGWDVGETRTLCSVFIGNGPKQPTRLAWSTDAETADDYKKGASWQWTTQ